MFTSRIRIADTMYAKINFTISIPSKFNPFQAV